MAVQDGQVNLSYRELKALFDQQEGLIQTLRQQLVALEGERDQALGGVEALTHALRRRGYQPILLRDCSTAIETRETIEELAITHTVLVDLERWVFTADSTDFISACRPPAR